MKRKASSINLTSTQHEILSKTAESRTSRKDHITRATIVLLCATGLSNVKIAEQVGLKKVAVGRWRRRWNEHREALQEMERSDSKDIDYRRFIESLLSDAARPGTPPKFTEEQLCQILSVASEKPEDSDLPLSHWSLSSLATELQKRGIVESISTSQLCVFLKSGADKAAQSG